VLLGFATLLFLTLAAAGQRSEVRRSEAGYHVTAEFTNIGDLKVGAPATMAGVRVGEVSGMFPLDSRDYKAVVSLRIDSQYKQIPRTASPASMTTGAARGQVTSHQPGGSTLPQGRRPY